MSEKTILPVQPASVQPLRATGTVCGFAVRPGLFLLNGATPVPGGVSFTIHSIGAVRCELCLFRRTEQQPYAVLPFPDSCRIGNTWSMIVFGLEITEFEYAYRMDGPYDPARGLLLTGRASCSTPMPAPSPDKAGGGRSRRRKRRIMPAWLRMRSIGALSATRISRFRIW